MKVLKIIGSVLLLFVCFLGAGGFIGEFFRELKGQSLQAQSSGPAWRKYISSDAGNCSYEVYQQATMTIGICHCTRGGGNDGAKCGISVSK